MEKLSRKFNQISGSFLFLLAGGILFAANFYDDAKDVERLCVFGGSPTYITETNDEGKLF